MLLLCFYLVLTKNIATIERQCSVNLNCTVNLNSEPVWRYLGWPCLPATATLEISVQNLFLYTVEHYLTGVLGKVYCLGTPHICYTTKDIGNILYNNQY